MIWPFSKFKDGTAGSKPQIISISPLEPDAKPVGEPCPYPRRNFYAMRLPVIPGHRPAKYIVCDNTFVDVAARRKTINYYIFPLSANCYRVADLFEGFDTKEEAEEFLRNVPIRFTPLTFALSCL